MENREEDIDTYELDRLLGEKPGPDVSTHECHIALAEARCNGNASEVLARCREVLAALLRLVPADWPEQGEGEWPTVAEWRSGLPRWFVLVCGPEYSADELEAEQLRMSRLPQSVRLRLSHMASWPVGQWVGSFETSRAWFWWDAEVVDSSTLRVWHAVWDLPYEEGALRWLLLACGATEVRFDWQ